MIDGGVIDGDVIDDDDASSHPQLLSTRHVKGIEEVDNVGMTNSAMTNQLFNLKETKTNQNKQTLESMRRVERTVIINQITPPAMWSHQKGKVNGRHINNFDGNLLISLRVQSGINVRKSSEQKTR